FAQALMECSQQMLGLFRRTSAHKANERHGRLSARRNWPRRYGPAKKFDELAPPHYGPPRLRTSIIPGQVNTLRGSAYALSGSEPMSALGQKQTFAPQKVMSALPPKADMCGAVVDVRFGP